MGRTGWGTGWGCDVESAGCGWWEGCERRARLRFGTERSVPLHFDGNLWLCGKAFYFREMGYLRRDLGATRWASVAGSSGGLLCRIRRLQAGGGDGSGCPPKAPQRP